MDGRARRTRDRPLRPLVWRAGRRPKQRSVPDRTVGMFAITFRRLGRELAFGGTTNQIRRIGRQMGV